MTCDGDFCNKPLDIKATRHPRRKQGFMRLGQKTLLLGAHAFWIHPFIVAWGWWRLFGFPRDPRLWLSFMLHDAGYYFCEHLDDAVGKRHPEFGAKIMGRLFGETWQTFTMLHSRDYAKLLNLPVSRLYYADKMAQVLEPSWMYVPRAWWTGEIYEYFEVADRITWERVSNDKTLFDLKMGAATLSPRRWHRGLRKHMAARIKKELTEAGINNRITV